MAEEETVEEQSEDPGQRLRAERTSKTVEKVEEQAGIGDQEPQLPPSGIIAPTLSQEQPGEIISDPEVAPIRDTPTSLLSEAGLEVPKPSAAQSATAQTFVDSNTPEFEAAKGQVSSQSLIGDIQGAVSAESIAQAQTEQLDERATVQFQIGELFKSLEEGKPPPAWAAPAVRKVTAIMAQRGLGSSSMAAAAIQQSIMESGIPIAAADAARYSAIQTQNLNNKQQATLQNAMTYASMDKANLTARLQTAVNNAQSFLKMDMQNLTGEQQLQTIDLQAKYQKLVSDSAQENAIRQFNAKSEMQVDQFYSEMEVQIDNANSNRLAAIREFNADSENTGSRFLTQVEAARDTFNSKLSAEIDQSNAVWRRNINTANTTTQNETNRINAANLLNISQEQLNKLWQEYRDDASWIYNSVENAAQRSHQIALFGQDQEFRKEMYETEVLVDTFSSIGDAVMVTVFDEIGSLFK